MKKSTIWLLAVVMAFAFAGLLYLQINYVDIILKTRSEQFDETVKQCLHQVSKNLELDETRQYLEDDINRDQNSFLYQNVIITDSDGGVQQIELQSFSSPKFQPRSSLSNQQTNSIVNTSRDLQKTLKQRYQYQGGLIDEVIYNILYTANLKPIQERVNFKKLNSYLKNEFINSGLNLPFVFSVINKDGNEVYRSGKIDGEPLASDIITQVLFPNDPPSKQNYLKVYFPTKGDYISNSITFIVPSVIFSMILLITFIFTIYIVFRQKRLSEMKNDFINNMTHELKTPVSTISLAAQMLKDSDITKSPEVFKHISGVINDETKRLGFLVEKVLQMSLFERQKATLKLKELDYYTRMEQWDKIIEACEGKLTNYLYMCHLNMALVQKGGVVIVCDDVYDELTQVLCLYFMVDISHLLKFRHSPDSPSRMHCKPCGPTGSRPLSLRWA